MKLQDLEVNMMLEYIIYGLSHDKFDAPDLDLVKELAQFLYEDNFLREQIITKHLFNAIDELLPFKDKQQASLSPRGKRFCYFVYLAGRVLYEQKYNTTNANVQKKFDTDPILKKAYKKITGCEGEA